VQGGGDMIVHEPRLFVVREANRPEFAAAGAARVPKDCKESERESRNRGAPTYLWR
jgi:hypothetical protein